MTKRPRRKKDRDELREEVFRPSPYLGYDHLELAEYLIGREVYRFAESELRRAIWLNPYEAHFKIRLAWCLLKQGREEDAREWIAKALAQKPDDAEALRIRRLLSANA